MPAIDSWSAFGASDLAALKSGGIQMKSNPSMTFPRGLSAQAVYVVDANVESAAQVLRSLDASRYPQLEVFQQRTFRVTEEARFAELKFDAKTSAFQHLLDETISPRHLQLSPDERAHLPRPKTAAAAQVFWTGVIEDRSTRFLRDGQCPATGDFNPRSEIRSLLQEETKVAAHFEALLQPWVNASGNPGAAAAACYWDVSSTDGLANLELGAIFERPEGERRQVADVTYYSSSGYIASVSLFEFIPVAGRAPAQTLVWQGTLVSSADVAGAFGLKRKFAIRTVEDQMKQWIGIFRQACIEWKK